MVDDSYVVTQSQAADVSGILPLLVTTDKGARQPAVLLLDMERGRNKQGEKRNKIYMLATAVIEPRPNIHSYYLLCL